ncbi:hypothetical protein O181_105746 [Austropuccinia psidii MF-1]|uniref:Uncharacterized protein n=1 Tax=Austropuccinia psidii MF-1 TaxID=1389203 RepID=A0A9Q3PMK2_9BASI|nr:hypothetical protein [Austropuccinia psidii MF-1]
MHLVIYAWKPAYKQVSQIYFLSSINTLTEEEYYYFDHYVPMDKESLEAQDEMSITTSHSQEAIESLTAKYHYHFEQLNLRKDTNSGDASMSKEDSNQAQGNYHHIILKQYSKFPIDKVQACMFAICQCNEIVEYLGNNWPIAPNKDIISYWKVS